MKNQLLFYASLGIIAAGCLVEPNPPETNPIELTATDTVIVADGYHTIHLTAMLGKDVDPDKEITFSTNWGFFAGIPLPEAGKESTLKKNASGGKASVRLIADTVPRDTVTVYASVEGSPPAMITIPIHRAFPDSLWGELDKGSIAADMTESATVTAHLHREPGFVTRRHIVNFEVIPTSLAVITKKAFSGESTAVATVRSATKDTGSVMIVVSTLLKSGAPKTDTMRLKLVP